MGDRVLNDKRVDPLGMRKRNAEAHRAAVILHIERVMGQTDRLGEVVYNGRNMVEGVGEQFRGGPVAVSEPGVIGRDQVIAIGKSGEKGLEHPR